MENGSFIDDLPIKIVIFHGYVCLTGGSMIAPASAIDIGGGSG